MLSVKRFGDKTNIAAAFAVLMIVLFAPAAARAQWTTPDAGGNINSTNTGNVGVGTTAPASKLDVNGTAAVSGDLKVASSRLKFTFSGPEGYVQGATERLSFWTTNGSGGQAVRMRFGGNAATSTAEFLNVSSVQLGTGVRLALGTTAPEGILDVRGGVASSGNGLPIILSAQQGAGSGSGGNVIINAGPNGPTGATGQIIFGIGGGITAGNLTTGEKMRITDSGYVGIGTSAPLQKFQLGTNTPMSATVPDAISLGATYSNAAGANPKLRLYDDNAGSVYGLGVSTSQFDFMIPANARYAWNVNGVEKMRLDTSGNLGIGKTAGASYKLDVNGNINGAGFCMGGVCKNDWSQVGEGATTVSAANVSAGQFGSSAGGGNFSFPASVGVGTATPDKLFTVQGQIPAPLSVMSVIRTTGTNTGFGLALDATGSGNNNLGFMVGGVPKAGLAWDVSRGFLGFANVTYGAGADFGLRLNTDGSLTFHDGSTYPAPERFRVTASGNVGIGTSTPLSGLVGNAGMELYTPSAVATFRIGTGLAGKNNAQVRFAGTSGDNWAIGSDVATHSGSRDFHFYDFAGTPGARLTVQSATGNVGIGTSAPNTAKLVIAGSAGTPGLDLASSDMYADMRVIRNSLNAGDKDLYLQYQAGAGSKTHIYSNNAETITVVGGKVGIGNNNPSAVLDVAGAINATGAITGATVNATYQDVAEWVPSTQKLEAATVVVLDGEKTNHVLASTASYDTKVAGVVSARPGIALGEGGEGKALVATTGRVKVKVDATRAPIRVGDLLVTSDVEGVAMRSEPIEIGGRKIHAPGTIIGKALEPLASGTGEILVLLSLQ